MSRWWSGNHPASGQEDFPGVDQWEAMTSPMDICQIIHQGWVRTSGNVLREGMFTGSCAFGRGIDIFNPLDAIR